MVYAESNSNYPNGVIISSCPIPFQPNLFSLPLYLFKKYLLITCSVPGPPQITGISAQGTMTSKTLESPSWPPSLSSLKFSQQPKQAEPTSLKSHFHLPLSNLTVSASVGTIISPLLDQRKSKLIFTTLLSIFTQSLYNPVSLPRWIQPCDLSKPCYSKCGP